MSCEMLLSVFLSLSDFNIGDVSSLRHLMHQKDFKITTLRFSIKYFTFSTLCIGEFNSLSTVRVTIFGLGVNELLYSARHIYISCAETRQVDRLSKGHFWAITGRHTAPSLFVR